MAAKPTHPPAKGTQPAKMTAKPREPSLVDSILAGAEPKKRKGSTIPETKHDAKRTKIQSKKGGHSIDSNEEDSRIADKYAEVDNIFGDLNLNKASLKAPAKPINIKAIAQAPKPKPAKPKPVAKKTETHKATYTPKGPTPAQSASAAANMEDLSRRIEALKQQTAYNPHLDMPGYKKGQILVRDPSTGAKLIKDADPKKPKPKLAPREEIHSSRRQEEDLDGFIVDSEEEGEEEEENSLDEEGDWRAELRKVTRIDPNKYRRLDMLDDRSMDSGWSQQRKEEAHSSKLGRQEDLIEERKELELQRKIAAQRAARNG